MPNVSHERAKLIFIMGLSAAISGVALYIIAKSDYPDAVTKWAFGAIGIVLGYWLH